LLTPNCDLTPTKFLMEETILGTIQKYDLSIANDFGYIMFGNESLIKVLYNLCTY